MNEVLRNFCKENKIFISPIKGGYLCIHTKDTENYRVYGPCDQEREYKNSLSWEVEFEKSEGEKVPPRIEKDEDGYDVGVAIFKNKDYLFPLEEVVKGGFLVFRQKKSTRATTKTNIRRFRIEALV